jgi:RHS repeat-associated protein
VYVYGVDGQKIGTYTFTLGQYGEGNTPEMTNSTVLLATFFVHKRIGVFDRLGSAKYNQQNNQAQSFYPYGEDRGTVEPNDALKFATYTRDAATGLDYADQRYYASNFGRMMSSDPYMASGGPRSPASWNRYTYAIGDPVNRMDPSGRYACDPDDPDCPIDECTPGDGDCSDPQPDPCGPQPDADLAPAPGPTPCEAPPPPPAPEPEQPTPDCDIQLRENPLFLGAVHAYLYVTDRNGNSNVLEGVFSGSIPRMLLGLSYLNGSVSPTGAIQGDDPTNYTANPIILDFASLLDVNGLTEDELCDWVDTLVGLTDGFPRNKVRYSWTGKTNPNSNSFTRWLLAMIGTVLPEPKGAVGWNHKIFGH